MRKIQDSQLLEYYLHQKQILSHFDTPNLQFHMFQFDKGEFICNTFKNISYLHFVVKGSFEIYAQRENGSQYKIVIMDTPCLLGDMELFTNPSPLMFVEAREPVCCISLSLRQYQQVLLNDNRFLRFLLDSISNKFYMFLQVEVNFKSVEEKLLNFMENECPDFTIHSIEKTCAALHCSRRQLHRILKKLTESGIIEKIGKGTYKKKAHCP